MTSIPPLPTRRRAVSVGTHALLILALLVMQACAAGHTAVPRASPASDSPWWGSDTTIRASFDSQIRFSGWNRSGHYITMRDGTRIATELYLPNGLPGRERIPTILVQTRYYRAAEFRWPASRTQDGVTFPLLPGFIRRGYAVVSVDVRGTGASFGRRDAEWSPAEVRDGAEIVDWIISQPWSNGMVGATGLSYPGTTAELLLVNGHPAVKAVAPLFAPWDLYADLAFPGGALLHGPTRTWSELTAALDRNDVARTMGWKARLAFRGVRPVDGPQGRSLLKQAIAERAGGFDVLGELSRMTFRDDVSSTGWSFDAVSPHALAGEVKKSRTPVYNYSGWFDGAHQDAAIKRYLALGIPGSRLVLGPWGHSLTQNASPYSPASRTAFLHAQELLRFFDYHLKGIDHGFAGELPIHYFTMGEEKWKSAESWPVPGTELRPLYVGAGNTLMEEPASSSWVTDTLRADLEIGTGRASRWNSLVGGRPVQYEDRAVLTERILTYTSAPLPADVEVTGYPVVTLFVRSTAPDGLFFVYLEELDAAGRVQYVTEGVLRAVHRRLSDAPAGHPSGIPYRTFKRADAEPLIPGAAAELEFTLLPTSWLFRAGKRVRVSVAAADSEHFVRPTHTDHATVEVLAGPEWPSRIELPVVVPRARAHGTSRAAVRHHD